MSFNSISVPDGFSNPDAWRELLSEWIELLHNFSTLNDKEERDVPYWYGERPLTGLLAAAAWRLENGWSLEEFSTLRGQEEDATKGRADLWMGIGNESYTVEAKLTWPQGGVEAAIHRIRNRLREARTQLRNIEAGYHEGVPLSVCYVVPWPIAIDPIVDVPKAIELMREAAHTFQTEGCAVALFVPHGETPIEDERIYPGVILVARQETWTK